MGCSTSKAAGTSVMRMLEYQKMAETENNDLKVEPKSLSSEDWKEGLISPRTFYNWFHAGFCSAYIQNPKYMLIIDFRHIEDWLKERVATSIHHDRIQQYQQNLFEYSEIVLYDRDGCSIGNIKSPLRKQYLRLKNMGLDPRIILGGYKSLERSCFSSLRDRPKSIPFASQVELMHNSMEDLPDGSTSDIDEPEHDLELVHPSVGKIEPERKLIRWHPSMILLNQLYLGTLDQASDPNVIKSLGITHILSTSRVRPTKIKGLVYIIVNKTSFSLSTIKLTNTFIIEAIEKGGRILVHGCDGMDQSAAVVTAALIQMFTTSLEDSFYYVESSRSGVGLSCQWIRTLLRLEEDIFGKNITDIDTLWI